MTVPEWTWNLWITVPLAFTLLVFALGVLQLSPRVRRGARALERRILLFCAGWVVLAGALVSPLHQLGERSFAAHMLEHELLMLLAAPLLVLSEPLVVMLWALPPGWRVGLGRIALSSPVANVWQAWESPLVATFLQAAALWLWHAPALFDRALASNGWHIVQHLCFVITGLIFWHAMLSPATSRPVAVLCLFSTSMVAGALGALMAFAVSPWYARYAALGMAPFDLTPTQDQQLAGLLMWVPGGLVHIGAALAMIHAMTDEVSHAPSR